MALLFFLSSQTDLDAMPSGWDKPAHAAAYAVLGALAMRACHGGIRRPTWLRTLAALALTLGYGLLDEWHQAFVAGRHASLLDWTADAVGAAVAVAAIWSLVAVRGRMPDGASMEETDV